MCSICSIHPSNISIPIVKNISLKKHRIVLIGRVQSSLIPFGIKCLMDALLSDSFFWFFIYGEEEIDWEEIYQSIES